MSSSRRDGSTGHRAASADSGGPVAEGDVGSAANEWDPVGFLVACHDLGRRRLAEAVATLGDESQTAGAIATVAQQTHTYLTVENPLHELDEEQLVAPALRTFADEGEVESLVAPFVHEHVRFDRIREALAAAWAEIARNPARLPALRPELEREMKHFAVMLEAHASAEERAIFPKVRALVPLEHQRSMLEVMRARRVRGAT